MDQFEGLPADNCVSKCELETKYECKSFTYEPSKKLCKLHQGNTVSNSTFIPLHNQVGKSLWQKYIEKENCEEELINGPNGIPDSNIAVDAERDPIKRGISKLRMVFRQFFYPSESSTNYGSFQGQNAKSYVLVSNSKHHM